MDLVFIQVCVTKLQWYHDRYGERTHGALYQTYVRAFFERFPDLQLRAALGHAGDMVQALLTIGSPCCRGTGA